MAARGGQAAARKAACDMIEGSEQKMDLGIKGRRAVVNGGSSGIGRETARLFLEEGARVVICGRDGARLEAARDDLARLTGGEVHAVQADMSREPDITRL